MFVNKLCCDVMPKTMSCICVLHCFKRIIMVMIMIVILIIIKIKMMVKIIIIIIFEKNYSTINDIVRNMFKWFVKTFTSYLLEFSSTL